MADTMEVARAALVAIATGDEDTLATLLAEDAVLEGPNGVFEGRDAVCELIEDRETVWGDIDWSTRAEDAVGDRAWIEWRFSATHVGPMTIDEDEVLEPTGKRISLQGVAVMELRDGKIASIRNYWDEADLLEGLGVFDEDGD